MYSTSAVLGNAKANSTQTAAVLAAGVTQSAVVRDKGRGFVACDKALSAILNFAASAAGTYKFRLWMAVPLDGETGGNPARSCKLQSLGAGSFTVTLNATPANTPTISGTGTPADGLYLADTLSYTASSAGSTPKGPATDRASMYGETLSSVFSPADTGVTPAELTLGSLGRGGALVIEFTDGAATVQKNALVQVCQV
jgi:hypothetical protein